MKKTMMKVFCAIALVASTVSMTFAMTESTLTTEPAGDCKWSGPISSGGHTRYDCIATGTGTVCKCGATYTEP